MNGNFTFFEDIAIGATFREVKIEEINNCHGQHYFKATLQIESIFGSEVDWQISAMGSTKEKCLENLQEEIRRFNEALWI